MKNNKKSYKIVREADAYIIPGQIKKIAHEIGFDEKSLWEIELAVSELVDNVIKYAGNGTITIKSINKPRNGIKIIVDDDGPGIEDIDKAVIDGFSQGAFVFQEGTRVKKSLGTGLGTVKRMMSRMIINNKPHNGVRIVAYKWLKENSLMVS